MVQASCVTCPPTCPFYYENLDNGQQKGPCYALNWPLALFWMRLSRGEAGSTFLEVTRRMRELPPGHLVRYGDIGDLPGKGNKIDREKLLGLSEALTGKVGWCYTHKPVLGRRRIANRAALGEIQGGALVINLSAEGWNRPDALLALRLGPVVTVLPQEMGNWRRAHTNNGVEIRRCPAEYSVVTCSTCGGKRGPICARWDREYVVGFTAHGHTVKASQRIYEVEMGLLGWD